MKNINPIIIQLLNNRGLTSEEEISEFLSPSPKVAYDPFLLLNMRAGVDLIVDAINNRENICIYGDYDADGITSISVLKSVLDKIGAKVDYYIPSRFDEGYGLNREAILKIKEMGADLIITVDCGTVSYEEVDYAKELGLKIMVTDHHMAIDRVPDCIVINPKQPGCPYPFKGLAGCGVTFKLVSALQKTMGFSKTIVNDTLDFVAIGTIGDVVPLVDENRTIVKYGISKINKYNRRSIGLLIKHIFGSREFITSESISYKIVPHLNAAGRIDHANLGAQLFLNEDVNEIEDLSKQLVLLNNERRKRQQDIYEECLALYKKQCLGDGFPVIYSENAHEGITGIVAGKLKDELKRPVAIVTPHEDFLKGTSRGVEGMDLYETIKAAEDLFIQFGGHKGACGFRLEAGKLDQLREILNGKVMDMDFAEDSKVNYDMKLTIGQVSKDLVLDLNLLEPFGAANEKPVFLFDGVAHVNERLIGKTNDHLSFAAVDPDNKKASISVVFFHKGKEKLELLKSNTLVSIVGRVNINTGYGNKLQIIADDILPYGEDGF